MTQNPIPSYMVLQIQPEEALNLAIKRAKEWQQAQSEKSSPLYQPRGGRSPKHLLPKLPNSLTCFTYASWKPDGSAGFGWVVKDHQNQIRLKGSTSAASVSSPLMAEVMTTLSAVGVALESDLNHLYFA